MVEALIVKTLKTKVMNIEKIEREYNDICDVNGYEEAAEWVAGMLGVTLTTKFLRNDYYWPEDKDTRDIYECTLTKGKRSFTFEFGQSVQDSQYYEDKINKKRFTLNGKGLYPNRTSYVDGSKYITEHCTLKKGKEPTMYDVLPCLTKYDPGSFEDFCNDFGYDEDSRKAENTYNAVLTEFKNMQTLFSDEELEVLHIIN